MIRYKVVHHIPGRIRLSVPLLKKVAMADLKGLSDLPVPEGIKNVRVNPLTGSLVIEYDPTSINIMEYIPDMVASEEIKKLTDKYLKEKGT